MLIRGTSSGAEIELTRDEWSKEPDGTLYYLATIRTGGLEVCHNVYAYDPKNEGLAKFFADLASDWRGWDGIRRWSSLEGEFEIECEHDGLGHIRTIARIHENRYYGDGWTGEIRFEVAAGQLDEITRDLTKFFKI